MLYALRIIVFLALLAPALSFSQESLWTQKADIPTARWHLSSVAVNDKIYAIGGVNGYNSNEEYDPATIKWTVKKSMPTGRAFIGTGVVDGKIYVIGGSILFGAALNTVEMYDPADNSWTSKASLPTGRHGVGSCAIDGRIYVIGGSISTSSALTAVELYDPLTDEWTVDLADMPTARWEPECAAVNGKIYVIGGFPSPSSGASSDAVEMYDPVANEWTIKASLPERRGGGTVVYVNGLIYYFGGSPSHGGPQNNVFAYDPASDEWTILPDMPFAWFLMTASSIDGKVYLMAGAKIAWPHNDNFHGLYSYQPPDITTNIEQNKIVSKHPEVIALGQNYPNPFNPTTTIFYSLPKNEYVQIHIFDALGRVVQTLIADNQNPGNHQVTWNGLDNTGSPVASGVYFCTMTSGGFSGTRKLLLLR